MADDKTRTAADEDKKDKIKDAIAAVTAHYEADIMLYSGPIFPPHDDTVVSMCRKRRRRKNLLLVIDTPGGSADAAFRMARAFRRYYSEAGQFIIYVPRYCKSAGTIISVGSDRIIMAVESELGPIDVQLRKDDEVGERTSGLTPHQALDTLAGESVLHFRRFFFHLRYDGQLSFTTKLAAEMSSKMTIGLMAPVYEQLDPLRMGEIERFVKISTEYGERLATKNVRSGAVPWLAGAYPSHGFVIDREEAREHIFHEVEKPTDDLEVIGDLIAATGDGDQPRIMFINPEFELETKVDSDEPKLNDAEVGLGEGKAGPKVRQNSARPETAEGGTNKGAKVAGLVKGREPEQESS